MKLLAIETSGPDCSVALALGGIVEERHLAAPRRHGEVLLPWIDELLAKAQLDGRTLKAIALSRGPGSFTSLRLGASVAVGLALGWQVPLIPVSSLAVLAAAAAARHPGTRRVAAALDARRGQFYFAAFEIDNDHLLPRSVEQLAGAAEIVLDGGEWLGAGPGFVVRDGELAATLAPHLSAIDAGARPRAAVLARLARHVRPLAAEDCTVHYLRDHIALEMATPAASGNI